MQVALVSWAMQRVAAAGFLPHGTPDLVRATVLEKCGFQPRGDNTQVRCGTSHFTSQHQQEMSICHATAVLVFFHKAGMPPDGQCDVH
jgi:seryl-tRNA synthetase